MKKRVIITVMVLLVIVGVTSMIFFKSPIKKNDKLIQYFEKTLNVKISDVCISADGEVEKSLFKEEFAYICIEIDKSEIETVKERLRDSHLYEYSGNMKIPSGGFHVLAQKLNNESVESEFAYMTSGKFAKTRDVSVYISTDSEDRAYIYMFG